MNTVKIFAKQTSNWGLLIGSFIFLFCSVYLFLHVENTNSPETAKIVSGIIFVPSLILFLLSIKKLMKKQLVLLIDTNGIVFHPTENLNYIKWNQILEIEELKLPRQLVINIKSVNSENYIESESNKILQARMKFWFQMYEAVVSFDANTLDKNHFEIMNIFDEFMDNYKKSVQLETH